MGRPGQDRRACPGIILSTHAGEVGKCPKCPGGRRAGLEQVCPCICPRPPGVTQQDACCFSPTAGVTSQGFPQRG